MAAGSRPLEPAVGSVLHSVPKDPVRLAGSVPAGGLRAQAGSSARRARPSLENRRSAYRPGNAGLGWRTGLHPHPQARGVAGLAAGSSCPAADGPRRSRRTLRRALEPARAASRPPSLEEPLVIVSERRLGDMTTAFPGSRKPFPSPRRLLLTSRHERNHARQFPQLFRPRPALPRHAVAGHAPRWPRAQAVAGVHGRGRAHARARHGRHRGHLQRRQRRAARAAALRRPGRRVMIWSQWTRLRQDLGVRGGGDRLPPAAQPRAGRRLGHRAVNLTGDGEPVRVGVGQVTANTFETLGVAARSSAGVHRRRKT